MISLRETARRHDASKGYLSERVRARKPVKGHDLHQYAVVEDGQIQGFSFPADYTFPVPPNTEQANERTPNERRENPGKRASSGLEGDSSTTEIIAEIDEQLRSPNERPPSALQSAGLHAAKESATALSDALRENPSAIPLLADPARHATTLGMGLLAGWWLNRRFASVSGTITGALVAATAADVFLRRDESILMRAFSRGSDDAATDDASSTGGMDADDLIGAEDPSAMIERIMQSAYTTTN